MIVMAAAWKRPSVSIIRANDLWNKPQLDNAQSFKDKFDQLFLDLRDEANAANPETSYDARISALPLIAQSYADTQAEIQTLLATWVNGTDEEIKETGAADEDGRAYSNYSDGEAAHTAYAQLLDKKVTDSYNATKAAFYAAVQAGGGAEWILSEWEANRIIAERKNDFVPTAMGYVGTDLSEIVTRQPRAEYESLVRQQVGKTFGSAQEWRALENSYFESALGEIENVASHVPHVEAEKGEHEEYPWQLASAMTDLRGHEQVYTKGQLLPLLGMACSKVKNHLLELDSALYAVMGSKDAGMREAYRSTYAQYTNYWNLRCNAPAAPDTKMPYERVVVFTTDTFPNKLRGSLKTYWDSTLHWASIEEGAARLGLGQELETDKAAALAELDQKITDLQEDPWSGPLGRDPNGNAVPYAAIDIGGALYKDWMNSLALTEYFAIYDKYMNSTYTPVAADYVPTSSYAQTLVNSYKAVWNNDPLRGVALEPDFVKASVLDPHWRSFETAVLSKAGTTYAGVDEFKKDVANAFAAEVAAAKLEADGLRTIRGKEYPHRLAEIEDLASTLGSSGLPIAQAQDLFAEVKALRADVPWNPDLRARYDKLYQSLVDYLAPGGGATKVPHLTDTTRFYDDESAKFLTATKRDEDLADWLGLDYQTNLASWETSLRDGLIALQSAPNLTDATYPYAQAAILKQVTGTYITWRSGLIDQARGAIRALTARLHTGDPSPEEITRAENGAKLVHALLMDEINDLGLAVQQRLSSGLLVGAIVKPFTKFEPLKSTSGFDVEEFSFKHLSKFIDNWAKSRLPGGICIEPKINGFRTILEHDGKDVRIYLEGTNKDYSRFYTHLTEELKTLPPVILDGELIEKKQGTITPRDQLGKFRAKGIDDANIYVQVFDILYLDGEDLHDKPYEERLAIRNKFFAGRTLKHMHNLPSWKVSTEAELLKRAKEANDYGASEGLMAKTADSKYLLGRRTGEWSKCKSTSDLQVMVLGITKTKANDFVYKGGIVVDNVKGIAPSEIEELKGKKYVVLGNTFRTKETAKIGDHLEVSVTELVEQEGDKGKKYNWMLPKVKGVTTRGVDTLAYAKQVGQLLQASMTHPWDQITDIVTQTMSTTSVPLLRDLKSQTFTMLADINNARVRNFGWGAIELIRERLGQSANPAVTDRGVEKIYEVSATPIVSNSLVAEIQDQFRALTDDIQSSPQQKARDAARLRDTLTQYERISQEPILSEVKSLLAQVNDFIGTMQQSGTASQIDIDRKLSAIETDLDELIRTQPDTLVDDLAAVKTRMKALITLMGERAVYFQGRLDALSSSIDSVEVPEHTSLDVRNWLSITRSLISVGVKRLPDDNARFLLTVTIPLQLNEYWRELSDAQKVVFRGDFDALRDVLRSVKDMSSNIGGALHGAVLKIDLGCGDNKQSGYVGIDKRPLPGVDKVYDLENGIPYPDNTVGVVRAYHSLEHLSNPIKIMAEIHRVLRDGGVLEFEIPSTKGEGADANPSHLSRWNKSSFAFYTDDKLRNDNEIPFKFDLVRIEELEDPDKEAVYVRGVLRACKTDTQDNHRSDGAQQNPRIVAAIESVPELDPFSQLIMESTPTPPTFRNDYRRPQEYDLAVMVNNHYGYAAPEDVMLQLRPLWTAYLFGWDDYEKNSTSPNALDNFIAQFEYSSAVESIFKQHLTTWEGGHPEPSGDAVADLIREAVSRVNPNAVGNEHFSYGAWEFVTDEELSERKKRGYEWLQTTDFSSAAKKILEEGGGVEELAKYLNQAVSTELRDYDVQLEANARARKPKDYPWMMKVKKFVAPPGASPQWAMAQSMKSSLAKDPFVKEISDLGQSESDEDPFSQVIDKAVPGLITTSHDCGGYYAGLDANAYPLYVTALHCIKERAGQELTLTNGQIIIADIISIHNDLVMMRGREKVEGLVPLELAEKESPWAIGLAPVYGESELIHRDPTASFPYEGVAGYGDTNMGRRGWSGSPALDSQGRVVGVLSKATWREGSRDLDPGSALGYESILELQELYRKAGITRLGGAKLGAAARLTDAGEQSGEARLDFMAKEPSQIPVKGTLWTHIKGADPEHKDLSYDEMMKLSIKDDVVNLHHDARFVWNENYAEGFTVFLGNQEDANKMLDYAGGKLGVAMKLRQPLVWTDPKELDNRIFPPHTPGNVAGKDTFGKMYLVDTMEMLPSRMRSEPKGRRYFEFCLKFAKHPKLNGLWALSEEASKSYDLPGMLWKMSDNTPFWLRGGKDHEEEIQAMESWQKPTQEAIDKFLSQPLTASEFDRTYVK